MEFTINHLNWIISELSKRPNACYVDYEFFDEVIVFSLEKAKEMKNELLKNSGNNETLN